MNRQQTKKTKRLLTILPKQSGRDVQGHVAVRHQGGRHKRMYREIDWMRTKDAVSALVTAIELIRIEARILRFYSTKTERKSISLLQLDSKSDQ
jgi:ribosomal protein L2